MRGRKSRHALTALCVVATLAVNIAAIAYRTEVAQAQTNLRSVTIILDGSERHVRTSETTVAAALKEAEIKIGSADQILPRQDTKLSDGMQIHIVRVVEKIIRQEQPIAYTIKKKPTRELRVGLNKIISEGTPGLKHLYWRVRFEDGVLKQRKFMRAFVVTAPKARVILCGEGGAGVSRGSFRSLRILKMHATAYDPGPRSCGRYANGRTCTGMKAGYGVVAVDPRVIPLGSRLYIKDYGYAIAGDRGRVIKGNRIDLGFDTYSAAKRFGRKSVTVHVIE